jgi:CRISPR/Cas system-associated exonuclease Cas4 (RecB family)
MMAEKTSNENDFERLLHYLEAQAQIDRDLTTKKKVEKQKKEAIQQTKKIVQESTIEDFKELVPASKKVTGFDVERFEALMRAKLVDEYKKYQGYERPYISVSEIVSCIRQAYYARQKYEIDLKKQFQFSYGYLMKKLGTALHEMVTELYGFDEVEKAIVSEKFKVKGRADALRSKYLYEIKTIDEQKNITTYVTEHYYQGLIYAYILNTEYNYDLKTVTIVYIPRSPRRIFPFDVPIENSIAENLLKRATILHKCLATNVVPETLGATKEQCNYCAYKKFCDVSTKIIETEKTQPQKIEVTKEEKTAFLL